MFRAVVFGSTGATGRELVSELAHSDACSSVNAVTRREIKKEDLPKVFPNIVAGSPEAEKIRVHPVDYERLNETAGDSCKEVDVAFCCLGTTQSEAGGRAGFTKVDLGYVSAAAREAREAGSVNHFALVTAQGVNRSCPRLISNYIWTKARAEEEVLKQDFPKGASIWHPGFLDRGKDLASKRFTEKVAHWCGLSGLPVADLARAMRVYAEQLTKGDIKPKAEDIIETSSIRAYCDSA
mmetsp:Transcript_6687/g.16318  ORF Transcript_6687/g.16318 Transcript_6687/m.16318 type:complete len:238 (-) Transcript_6687:47-760(-)